MNIRRILAAALAAVMMLTIAGCGKEDSKSGSKKKGFDEDDYVGEWVLDEFEEFRGEKFGGDSSGFIFNIELKDDNSGHITTAAPGEKAITSKFDWEFEDDKIEFDTSSGGEYEMKMTKEDSAELEWLFKGTLTKMRLKRKE